MQLAGHHLRFGLFALSGTVSVAFGFWLVPPINALGFVQHGGYFVILAAFVWWVSAMVRLGRRTERVAHFPKADLFIALAAMAGAVLWQLHGGHGFKVLMDEYVLSTTAMNMHFNREIFVPLKTHEINGVYATLGGVVDKRPVFFPFLLSLVHDFTGYRPSNVFLLNGLLSAVLLFLVGHFARVLGRCTQAGLLAIALLAGLPLLAGNATGAGFEMLNLCLIVTAALLGARWLGGSDEATLDAFVLSIVLLAQTRYESAAFVVSAGLVIVWVWVRERRLILSWGTVAAPVLLILIPLQNKVFALNKGYWQLDNTTGGPFQLRFLSDNLGHAVEFLFHVDGVQLGSPVLSGIGLVCMISFLVYGARRWRTLEREPETGVLLAFAAGIVGNFLLLLCYHWGQLDDYMASRLALPLMLLFALAAAFAIGRWVRRPAVWVPVLALPLVWLLVAGIPISARSEVLTSFLTYREVGWQRDFVRERKGLRNLFILPSPLPAVLEREPAMSVAAFAERAEEMDFHLRERTYREVFVFQRIETDPATGQARLSELSFLGPEFVLETIEERRFRPLYVARVSRLVAVDVERQAARPADWKPSFPPFDILGGNDDPSPGGVYMREFLRKLP